jgi:DNA-directed RNA polymerase subunit RPC12/RpoP
MAVNMKCSHSGKDVFFTEDAARRAIASYFRKRGCILRVYVCPDCGHHHLTKLNARSTATMFKELLGSNK